MNEEYCYTPQINQALDILKAFELIYLGLEIDRANCLASGICRAKIGIAEVSQFHRAGFTHDHEIGIYPVNIQATALGKTARR